MKKLGIIQRGKLRRTKREDIVRIGYGEDVLNAVSWAGSGKKLNMNEPKANKTIEKENLAKQYMKHGILKGLISR